MSEINVKVEAIEKGGKLRHKFTAMSKCIGCGKTVEQEIQNMYLASIASLTLSLCADHNECPICRKKGSLYMDSSRPNLLACRICNSKLDRAQFEALKKNFDLSYKARKVPKRAVKKVLTKAAKKNV